MNFYLYYLGAEPNSILIKKKLFNLKEDKIFKNSNLKILKNTNYLIIKHFDKNLINNIQKLQKNNNTIIYEPIDFKWNLENIEQYLNQMKILNIANKIILPSEHLVKLLKPYIESKLYYNYHEYDNRFKLNTNVIEDNVYYIGDLGKTSFDTNIFKKYNIVHIKSSNNNNLLNKLHNSSIHIDYVKKNKLYYHLHTSTKLATALYFKSIFICNRIPIYNEILGDNYDFYFKDDLTDLNLVIQKAKNTILDKNEYSKYIIKMECYLNLFNPKNIHKKYLNIIKD